MRPGLNLTPDKPPLSREEQDRRKAVDDAYKSAIEKLPDKKKSADPWESVDQHIAVRQRDGKQ